MAKIEFKSGDDYIFKVSKLADSLKDEICGKAIYNAADIVTDEIRAQLEATPTDEKWGTPTNPAKGLKSYQKTALLKSLGITKMKDDGTGYLNVKAGFNGYNGKASKRWPKGQPNQMVARSLERGTSFLIATPFVKRAVSATRKKAVAAMQQTIDEETEKIMKG